MERHDANRLLRIAPFDKITAAHGPGKKMKNLNFKKLMWRRVLHLRRYKFESRLTLRNLTIDPSPAQTAADTTSYWHRITVVVEKYTMMTTAAIRHELLNGTDEDLQKRRYIVTLSALGLVDFAFLSLYQSGIIKRLPDLPFAAFDSNKVNASPDAYQMGAPDATIS